MPSVQSRNEHASRSVVRSEALPVLATGHNKAMVQLLASLTHQADRAVPNNISAAEQELTDEQVDKTSCEGHAAKQLR